VGAESFCVLKGVSRGYMNIFFPWDVHKDC
jgi:hypothetical protein